MVVEDDRRHTLKAKCVLLSNAKTSRGLVPAFGSPFCKLPGSSTWARPDLLGSIYVVPPLVFLQGVNSASLMAAIVHPCA